MNPAIRSLIAKKWKDETTDLTVGRHRIDEQIVLRITGTVEKFADQMVAPTVSIPLVPTLALFWEKCGIARDQAMLLLREAITEAMQAGVQENQMIKAQIDDVEKAIEAVRKDLISHLPKMARDGRLVTRDLSITVLMVAEVEETVIG